MQNQFERFRPQKEKFTGEYQKHTDENRAKRFMDIINDLLKIEGIVIEICGSFIWISGDTKPVKDQIKAIRNEAFKNAQWHTKKEMWYFAPIWYHKVSAGLSMDAIRNYYGSETFEAKREEKEEFKRIRA